MAVPLPHFRRPHISEREEESEKKTLLYSKAYTRMLLSCHGAWGLDIVSHKRTGEHPMFQCPLGEAHNFAGSSFQSFGGSFHFLIHETPSTCHFESAWNPWKSSPTVQNSLVEDTHDPVYRQPSKQWPLPICFAYHFSGLREHGGPSRLEGLLLMVPNMPLAGRVPRAVFRDPPGT